MKKKCQFCGGPAHSGNWCGSVSCLKSAYRRQKKDFEELLKVIEMQKKTDGL